MVGRFYSTISWQRTQTEKFLLKSFLCCTLNDLFQHITKQNISTSTLKAFTVSVKLLNLTSTGNNLTLCKLKMKYWQSWKEINKLFDWTFLLLCICESSKFLTPLWLASCSLWSGLILPLKWLKVIKAEKRSTMQSKDDQWPHDPTASCLKQ